MCGEGRLTGLTARANSGLAREYRRSPAEVLCTEREGAALTPEAARKVEHRKNASKDPSLPRRLLPASTMLSSIYPLPATSMHRH